MKILTAILLFASIAFSQHPLHSDERTRLDSFESIYLQPGEARYVGGTLVSCRAGHPIPPPYLEYRAQCDCDWPGHPGKLNLKMLDGSGNVRWHQDLTGGTTFSSVLECMKKSRFFPACKGVGKFQGDTFQFCVCFKYSGKYIPNSYIYNNRTGAEEKHNEIGQGYDALDDCLEMIRLHPVCH